MARDHAGTVLYRAVITRRAGSRGRSIESEITDVVGPYLTPSQARAQITRQSRWFDVVESHVEVAHPVWEAFEEEAPE